MRDRIRYRRVYEEPSPQDGARVLVDRIWPRGLRKEDARLDEWLPDVAPSTELRRWYAHDPERFAEFRRRYLAELRDIGPHSLPQRPPAGVRQRAAAAQRLRELAAQGAVTLLTATRDAAHSQAAVLAEWLGHSER